MQVLAERILKTKLSDYVYVGMGGAYLEDFRVFYRALRFQRMISFEKDESVCERQRHNLPCSNVDVVNSTSTKFVEEAAFWDYENVAVWLDFTTSELGQQLRDAEVCLRKLEEGDIFRVTLNAERKGLVPKGGLDNRSHKTRIQQRRAVLEKRLGDYWPSATVHDDSFKDLGDVVSVIRDAFSLAVARARGGRQARFRELHATTYADGTRMLSITGIIAENMVPDLRTDLGLGAEPVVNINVPALSNLERLMLEREIPVGNSGSHALFEEFSFLGKKDVEHLIRLSRYLPRYGSLE